MLENDVGRTKAESPKKKPNVIGEKKFSNFVLGGVSSHFLRVRAQVVSTKYESVEERHVPSTIRWMPYYN